MKRFILLLIFFSIQSLYAQSDQDSLVKEPKEYMEKHISILTGYNFWKNHYAELGIAINEYGHKGHHALSRAYFFSTEMRIDGPLLIAPKIGGWIGGGAGGAAMGINLIYYTDFNEGGLRLRPEAGIGLDRFKLVYGFNIPLTNSQFEAVNKSNISLVYLFGIKKISTFQKL